MIEAMVLSGLFFFIALAIHALWFHWRPPQNRWRAFTRLCLVFFGVYTITFSLAPFPNWFNILNLESWWARFFSWTNGALIYAFLYFSYAQFYFLIDRSVSARIMIEIEQSTEKCLRIEEIHQRYDPKGMQIRRLNDMLYGGYVIKEGDYYKNTKKGELHARIFRFCKKYLHLYPGG